MGFLAFIYYNSSGGRDWGVPIQQVSDALDRDGTEYRFKGEELLETGCWAMLLDQQGQVVWSFRKPQEVPEQYTVADVAAFTRWYLQDYPVQCWVREDGLLVVGSPKGSLWKHDIAMDIRTLLQTPFWFGGIFLLALGCVLGLSYRAARHWFRQAQQARDAARSEWINGVSHDIRTPDLSPTRQKQAAIIRTQSQAIRDLVNDLNLTMRLDCAMQPLRKETVHPDSFLRQIAADFLNGGMAEGFRHGRGLPLRDRPSRQAPARRRSRPLPAAASGEQPAHQLCAP